MPLEVGISSNPIPPIALSVGLAVNAESDGYDSVWYPDHLMGWFPKALWKPESSSIVGLLPSPHLYLDPTVVIALAGQATSRIKLATGVTDPIRRPPAELARTFLTLSHATGGRAILGIGAGERENTEPYGLDYSHQVSKLEESLEIIRRLWTQTEPLDFDGRFWKLSRAVIDIEGHEGKLPEVWVGAHGPKMLAITGRYGDGWYPSYPMQPEEYRDKLRVIRAAADEAGRDPAQVSAGYQMYVIVTEEHSSAHEIMASPLAAAMSLVAPAAQWEAAGHEHPFGHGFEGLRDYVPEWHSEDALLEAVSKFAPEVFHDSVVHGTVDEVVSQVEQFVDHGLQHVVFANMAPLAGMEYIPAAQAGLKEVARRLRQ